MQDTITKEYLRPFEIKAVFGIDRSTLYRWMKDKEFPKPLRPSKKVTLINRQAFEEYLKARSQKVESFYLNSLKIKEILKSSQELH